MSDHEETQRQEEESEEQAIGERIEETQRLTTQWNVEDEEEAARERRRRERDSHQMSDEGQAGDSLTEGTCTETNSNLGLKPVGPWESEEDEGFSDWSQRLEQRKLRGASQAPMEEEREGSGATEEEEEKERPAAPVPRMEEEEEEDEGTARCEMTELNDAPGVCAHEDDSAERYLQEEVPACPSYRVTREDPEDGEILEDIPRSPVTQEEKNEEAGRERERDGEPSREETEPLRDRWVTEDGDSRRRSVSSEGEESESSATATGKITERAECLNRSIQKSNSIKKSEPPLPISKIDDRLEQYTHAIETSCKPARLVRQPSIELTTPADAVSSKKDRWEAGEVTTASKTASCKDTEGINVAVSDLISQWVKGKSEPDGQHSPPRPTEVRPGDVLSKKSLWEHSSKSSPRGQGSAAGMKYKFVPTGHGKYEKVLMKDP